MNVKSHHNSVDTVTCHQDHQDAVHITAILGESVVFNCQVDFPEDIPVPYVLQWEKKVGETVRRSTLHSYNTTLLIYRVCFCSVEDGSSPRRGPPTVMYNSCLVVADTSYCPVLVVTPAPGAVGRGLPRIAAPAPRAP